MAGLSLGLGTGLGRAAGASAAFSEVWPQPDFDASTGLTLTRASVTGGELVFDDVLEEGALCVGLLNSPGLVVGQTWRVSGNCSLFNAGNSLDVRIGCSAIGTGGTADDQGITAAGAFSFDVELTTVTTQRACIIGSGTTNKLTSFSLIRIS